jgi:hypothetical protein
MQWMAALACLMSVIAPAGAQENAWDFPPWKGYSVSIRGQVFSCVAIYADYTGDTDYDFYISRERVRPSATIKFSDSDSDDNAFQWLNGKSVTLSVGPSFRGALKVLRTELHSFDFEVPSAVIDGFAAGGPFVLQLPKGKPYSLKLAPAAAAMANFRKCIADNIGK